MEVGEDLQNTVTDIGRISKWPTPEVVRKNLEDEYASKRDTLPKKTKPTARGRESQSPKSQSPKEPQANVTLVNRKRQSGRLYSPSKRSDSRDGNQLKRTTPSTCDICGTNHFKSKGSKVYFLAESEKAPQE